jgi:hypothetical protein
VRKIIAHFKGLVETHVLARKAVRRLLYEYNANTWTTVQSIQHRRYLLGLVVGQSKLCGFEGTGLPDFRVTDWPAGTPTRQEPACGAVFQPYGPVELGYVNSLVSELALDSSTRC